LAAKMKADSHPVIQGEKWQWRQPCANTTHLCEQPQVLQLLPSCAVAHSPLQAC
jgi:hypothetical protein